MSESEETKWRLGAEPEETEEKAAELSSEEDEKKEELQQTVQTKAEEIGGGGEGSLITRPEQANQLTRIEKVILPLQKSVNKIDKQSNTIKQLYMEVTQLQRQIRSTKSRKQNQSIQKKKKGKNLATSRSKKRSVKGRR